MQLLVALILAVIIAATGAAVKPSPKPSATPQLSKYQREKLERMKNSAPADEYFGKMKLSFLGIDNTFRDQSIRASDHTIDTTVISKVDFAAEAMRDWQRKYPQDPQLARSLWLGSQVYLKIWTTPGQQQGATYLIDLRNKFPSTYFGKQAKASLQKGLTMHVLEAAQPCFLMPNSVVSTPGPVPTANPKYNIKVAVVPAPCYAVTPAPTPTGFVQPPSPGATAGPSASPIAGPSASPTAGPSASPTVSPSASPSPSPR